jgi:hypothetical protein
MRILTMSIIFLALCLQSTGISAQVLGHVETTVHPSDWTYSIFNDEPSGSSNYIGYFTIAVAAPVVIVNTPAGWGVQTDNMSYVSWFNTDIGLPYPNDITPGASLGGFEIQSIATQSTMQNFTMSYWDHGADAPGPDLSGTASSPFVASVNTPEPSLFTVLAGAAATGLMLVFKRRKSRSDFLTRTSRPETSANEAET